MSAVTKLIYLFPKRSITGQNLSQGTIEIVDVCVCVWRGGGGRGGGGVIKVLRDFGRDQVILSILGGLSN